MADFDIVSDLSDGTFDQTISANDGDVSAHGADVQNVNAGVPAREDQTQQVRKVDDTPKADADKPLSLRDTISNALKTDATDATPPNGLQDGGLVRDPVTGQFLPKPDPAPAADPNAPPPAPVTAAPVGIDPAVFASLPAETQAQLARTMEGVTTQQQRFAALEPIEQLITPRIDAWALNGMQPAQALHQLLALSDFAGRDPGGFIKYIAQNNGVDLEDLVLGMEPEDEVDPRVAALEKELSEIRGVVQGQTQQQQQAAHERTVNDVMAFADEKGPDGTTPLRPHLSELGATWLPYISMVKSQNPNWSHAQVMQQAYENACWNNPGVRGKLQAATNAAAEADRLRKEQERVTAARTASSPVRSGAPSSPPAAPDSPNRSVRDTVKAAIAQHS